MINHVSGIVLGHPNALNSKKNKAVHASCWRGCEMAIIYNHHSLHKLCFEIAGVDGLLTC